MKTCHLAAAMLSLLLSVNLLVADQHVTGPAHRSCCAAPDDGATVPTLSDTSIYQLDNTWTNDAGKEIRLAGLKGRPQVVAMFFSNCQYACPLLVFQMQQIEASLPVNLRTNVGFLLVSFDPERDTPTALKDYRDRHHLGKNWTLLQGGNDDVLSLAALLGVKFRKDAQAGFVHSNVITVLNSNGEILRQQLGFGADATEIVRSIESLLDSRTQKPGHLVTTDKHG